MYLRLTLLAFLFSIQTLSSKAQTDLPKGFSNGSITVNGQTKSGWIKEDFKGTGCIQFIDQSSKKKSKLSGMDLQAFEIDTLKFMAIKGDIFKMISSGGLSLLQKLTHVSGRTYFNGLETVVLDGTEGKQGDYFLFLSQQNKLRLLTNKNSNALVSELFAGNELAINKANAVHGEWEQLKEAVDIFNSQRLK